MKGIALPPEANADAAPPPESTAETARGLVVRGGLLALAAAKAGKLGLTAGTMILSIWVYSLYFGWPYAAGFVALIFIHEMGHFLAARQRKLDVGAPTFIPFFGAWIALKDKPMNAETEAYVGLAGPVAGTIGAVICFFLGMYLSSPLLLALSYAGLFLNLFNLVPVSPFDGGRITQVLSPRIWLIGAPILLAVFLWQRNPLLIVMLILAAPQVVAAFRFDPKAPANAAYHATSRNTKILYGALYLGLVTFLAFGSYEVHAMLRAGNIVD
jgi:Zn-dependent protease